MIYPNLEAEMVRNGYSKADVANVLEIHVSGVYRILAGERKISITDAQRVRDEMFPEMRLDYLFDTTRRGAHE